jgi:hypothetical protein
VQDTHRVPSHSRGGLPIRGTVSHTPLSDGAEALEGVVPPTGGGSGFLSDVLVELGFASRETVEEAVRAAESPGATVAGALLETGAITEDQLARATAERHGVDYVDLNRFHVDPDAANLIKPTSARRYKAVPVARLGDALLVALADPADALAVSDVAVMTKAEVRPAVAARPALEALLDSLPLDEGGWERGDAATPAEEAGGAEEAPSAPEPEMPEPEAELSEPEPEMPEPEPELSEPEPEAATPRSGDASRLREELDELKRQLAGAEATLQVDATPIDNGEVEELRAQLAQARNGDAVAAEADELRAQVTALRQERDDLRSDVRRVDADAEVRTAELESLRTKLTEAETELVRVRAEVDTRNSDLDAMGARVESADNEAREALHRASEAEGRLDEERRKVAELEREAAEAQRLAVELAAAEDRAEQARSALAQMRQESESERERAAMVERELREKLGEEERRRAELEGRLSEVEGAAQAAERSFEELRLAQGRMRDALAALADPDAPDNV